MSAFGKCRTSAIGRNRTDRFRPIADVRRRRLLSRNAGRRIPLQRSAGPHLQGLSQSPFLPKSWKDRTNVTPPRVSRILHRRTGGSVYHRLGCSMHSGPHIFGAFVGGILLMWPLGWLFGVMGWPMFHSWGLAHGSWVIAFPLMILLAYLLIWAALKAR